MHLGTILNTNLIFFKRTLFIQSLRTLCIFGMTGSIYEGASKSNGKLNILRCFDFIRDTNDVSFVCIIALPFWIHFLHRCTSIFSRQECTASNTTQTPKSSSSRNILLWSTCMITTRSKGRAEWRMLKSPGRMRVCVINFIIKETLVHTCSISTSKSGSIKFRWCPFHSILSICCYFLKHSCINVFSCFHCCFLHYLHISKQYLVKTTGGQKLIFIIARVKGAASHVP